MSHEIQYQQIPEQLNKIRRTNKIKPSEKLEGRENGYNLTVEMDNRRLVKKIAVN